MYFFPCTIFSLECHRAWSDMQLHKHKVWLSPLKQSFQQVSRLSESQGFHVELS